MSKSTIYHIALFISIIALFGACNSKENVPLRDAKYGGTLRINTSSVPDIIFPGKVLKKSEQLIINQVYNGLVKYHPRTLEIVPAIAQNWLIEDKGTIYTFYIRKNALFHNDACFQSIDNQRIKAEDVKYSIEQISQMHLDQGHQLSAQIKNMKGAQDFIDQKNQHIAGIEVFDDTTLIFYLEKEDPMFIHFLAGSNSLVFAKEAYEQYGLESTVGSGAFTFSYPSAKGRTLILKANNNYYAKNLQGEQLPFIDSISITFIVSTMKELDMLENDRLDLVFDLPEKYITPFLDNHIDDFQNNPPYFTLKQISNANNKQRYHIVRSYIKGFELNAQGYFDFSETYLMNPRAKGVEKVN